MPVLKHISPPAVPVAPNALPKQVVPSSKTKTAVCSILKKLCKEKASGDLFPLKFRRPTAIGQSTLALNPWSLPIARCPLSFSHVSHHEPSHYNSLCHSFGRGLPIHSRENAIL